MVWSSNFLKSIYLQNRLLMETDSPDMIPYNLKESKCVNEPANLRYVAGKIAEFRGVSIEKIVEITTENARMLFLK